MRPRLCLFVYIVVCDGLIPAGWSHDTERESKGQWQVQCMSPFIPLSRAWPRLLSPDIWQLISDIVSERPGPDNCPTHGPRHYMTQYKHSQYTRSPYLSTYRRNPTVHFIFFPLLINLISYWTSPWITISNRNNPRLVTLFLCRYFWLSQCRTILIISDTGLGWPGQCPGTKFNYQTRLSSPVVESKKQNWVIYCVTGGGVEKVQVKPRYAVLCRTGAAGCRPSLTLIMSSSTYFGILS